jgi:hypothetical protein
MLPVVALVAAVCFLILHFSGGLDDMGRRRPAPGSERQPHLSAQVRSSKESEMNRRLKAFEDALARLSYHEKDPDNGEAPSTEPDSPKV